MDPNISIAVSEAESLHKWGFTKGATAPFGIRLYNTVPLPCRKAILLCTVSAWEGAGGGYTRLPLWGSCQRVALTEGATLELPSQMASCKAESYKMWGFKKGTLSRLPARALVASGDRSAPGR